MPPLWLPALLGRQYSYVLIALSHVIFLEISNYAHLTFSSSAASLLEAVVILIAKSVILSDTAREADHQISLHCSARESA